MSAGTRPLEQMIHDGVLQIVGDPFFMGALVLGFFAGFLILSNTSNSTKVAIMIPAFLLASAFIPPLMILIALGAAVALYGAIMPLISK